MMRGPRQASNQTKGPVMPQPYAQPVTGHDSVIPPFQFQLPEDQPSEEDREIPVHTMGNLAPSSSSEVTSRSTTPTEMPVPQIPAFNRQQEEEAIKRAEVQEFLQQRAREDATRRIQEEASQKAEAEAVKRSEAEAVRRAEEEAVRLAAESARREEEEAREARILQAVSRIHDPREGQAHLGGNT
jgi:hypothetical protein